MGRMEVWVVKQSKEKSKEMEAKEHQDLIKANIAAAKETGDFERVTTPEKVFAPLLALQLE